MKKTEISINMHAIYIVINIVFITHLMCNYIQFALGLFSKCIVPRKCKGYSKCKLNVIINSLH